MKAITIACTGAGTSPYQALVPFQGGLKTLPEVNYQKLKRDISELGFSEPISVWVSDNKYYILNGHQRLTTIKRMVEVDGYTCPSLPVNYVEADSYQQAKRKVLAMASTYGRMTEASLAEFMADNQITVEDLTLNFDFPTINLETLGELMGNEAGKPDPRPPGPSLSDVFGVPPFSVLDARQGYWQTRKKQWLSIGIQSELGRGGGG